AGLRDVARVVPRVDVDAEVEVRAQAGAGTAGRRRVGRAAELPVLEDVIAHDGTVAVGRRGPVHGDRRRRDAVLYRLARLGPGGNAPPAAQNPEPPQRVPVGGGGPAALPSRPPAGAARPR